MRETPIIFFPEISEAGFLSNAVANPSSLQAARLPNLRRRRRTGEIPISTHEHILTHRACRHIGLFLRLLSSFILFSLSWALFTLKLYCYCCCCCYWSQSESSHETNVKEEGMKMCFFFCFFHLLTIFSCLRFVVLVTFFLSFDVFFSQNFSCGRFVPQTERE